MPEEKREHAGHLSNKGAIKIRGKTLGRYANYLNID